MIVGFTGFSHCSEPIDLLTISRVSALNVWKIYGLKMYETVSIKLSKTAILSVKRITKRTTLWNWFIVMRWSFLFFDDALSTIGVGLVVNLFCCAVYFILRDFICHKYDGISWDRVQKSNVLCVLCVFHWQRHAKCEECPL